MLTKIPLLTFVIFSLTYPMCFWLSFRDPLKKGFHHFHIGLPAVTAGLSLVGMKLMAFPNVILVPALIWVVSIFAVSFIYLKRETVNPYAIIPLCFLGSYVYVLSHIFLFQRFYKRRIITCFVIVEHN